MRMEILIFYLTLRGGIPVFGMMRTEEKLKGDTQTIFSMKMLEVDLS